MLENDEKQNSSFNSSQSEEKDALFGFKIKEEKEDLSNVSKQKKIEFGSVKSEFGSVKKEVVIPPKQKSKPLLLVAYPSSEDENI